MPSERRPVTVLFADLVGFSSLAEYMDPEDLRTLIGETFTALTAEVEARDGMVEKFIGDAVMAIFGAPVAHEDDPDRAVDTALRMLEIVRQRSAAMSSPLQLRIGINSGLVVSGTVGDMTQVGVLGDAVNTAARLQQAAEPGEVMVSASVWRRVRDRYDAEHIGLLEVKGREQRVDAYRIVGPRRADARRLAPFVGRNEELALLELLWSSAAKGNAHVVSLIGEPGVGKSRLLSEFGTRRDALDVRIPCSGERAFGPFLDLIERILGGAPTDLDDLGRRTRAMGIDEDVVPLLGALLGLAGAPPAVQMADEQKKRQVFAGVWQFLSAAPGERPAMIVLDDVHWADRSSLDLLGFLLERLGGSSLMLLLAYRPGFDQVDRVAFRASHTAVRLEPLSADESVAMARGFLGVQDLPADLERLVATRAEGNPFFVEELLQALLELGSLAVVDGSAVLARVEVEVPDTVQGTILARMDRLQPKERSLLQHAAVIGRSFSTDLLQAVMGEGDLGPSLEELVRAQLLVAQGPDQWTFKHALIQEVTYDTLLLRQRRELHLKVAEALRAQAGEDPAFLELLAEHYAQAEAQEEARRYALAAGDLASERMGFVEARARYETAYRLWGEGDERGRVDLLDKLAWARLMAGDNRGAKTALVEAEAGWRTLGETQRAGATLAVLSRAQWISGEAERAWESIERAVQDLEPAGPTPELVRAYVNGSTVTMLRGRFDQSMPFCRRGLEIAEQLGLDGARSQLLNTLGVCMASEGDASGIDRLREALEIAERAGDAEAIGRAYVNLPSMLSNYGRNREALEIEERGREVLRRLGAMGIKQFVRANEAWSLLELGSYEDAMALAGEAMDDARAMGAASGTVNAGMTLADLAMRRGRYDDARRVLDEFLPLARGLGGTEFLLQALAREVELEWDRGNLAAAAQSLAEAVDIVLESSTVVHTLYVLVLAAALGARRMSELLDRVRDRGHAPIFHASLAEAEAWLSKDQRRFAEAADLYASLELPYQEARAALEAGELDRAGSIIKRFGLEDGPLGARLRELQT
ncbi:MAG TPA: adenylate/guanylate cyclase domain-containing protein [Actinomycetota bacterium]|nr:adenylate/guanylate cyclase domain-containing protein [Actinomycetota bacterium]